MSQVAHLAGQEFQPKCERLFTIAGFSVCVNFVRIESNVRIVDFNICGSEHHAL